MKIRVKLLVLSMLAFALASTTAMAQPIIQGLYDLSQIILSTDPNVLAASALGATSLAKFREEFGAYYQPRGQNVARLKMALFSDRTAFDNLFRKVPISGDRYEHALLNGTRVLQGFKPVWSELGGLEGTPMKSDLRRVKVNTGAVPDDLVDTWLGFLASQEGRDPGLARKEWPFVRWFIEIYLVQQALEDQFNEAFLSVYAPPPAGDTPSPAGTLLDGLHQQVNAFVDNGLMPVISTGPLEEDPEAFAEQIEAFAEQIDSKIRGRQLIINMADVYASRYAEGLQDRHALKPLEIMGTPMYQLPRRPNIKILGHTNWLQGVGGDASQKLICSFGDNFKKVVRVGNKEGMPFRVDEVDYKLKFFADWFVLYTLDDPRYAVTNDVELEYGLPEEEEES